MQVKDFLRYVSRLTGTELKGEDEIDLQNLERVLSEDTRTIDCSQFNELLLMVHKDRVEQPFFDHFFGSNCTVGAIPGGVEKFQITAMLLYGNFVFAYRRLSRIKDQMEFQREIAANSPRASSGEAFFATRRPKLLDIDRIQRDFTPFVGYLSANEVRADFARCKLLLIAAAAAGPAASWDDFTATIREMAGHDEIASLETIIRNFRGTKPEAGPEGLPCFLQQSLNQLEQLSRRVHSVRARAARNQDTYLTWDHMDVYFATSMRKPWEYKDLFDFISALMTSDELRELNLRYFDPTQAYMENRVNKGLVEALMLKRAACTVYSVQDADTLGKDSELASTLAQGKPVIAYVPRLDIQERTQQLMKEDPAALLDRLRFVLYADEKFSQRLTADLIGTVDRVEDALKRYCGKRIWPSLFEEEAMGVFRNETNQDLQRFCTVIASAEQAIYDSRAATLSQSHPLAIQVNLETGVANGVLVVRTIGDCAQLLRRVLLGEMEFWLEEADGMWHLRERISGCIYRVVTNKRKLNNCFWNFYLR